MRAHMRMPFETKCLYTKQNKTVLFTCSLWFLLKNKRKSANAMVLQHSETTPNGFLNKKHKRYLEMKKKVQPAAAEAVEVFNTHRKSAGILGVFSPNQRQTGEHHNTCRRNCTYDI